MRHLLCLSLLLLPVAAAPDEKPAEDPRRLKPDHAPTPYTADEIRAACPEGRMNVYRTEGKGKVAVTSMRFVKCDEKGAEMEFSVGPENAPPVQTNTSAAAWKDLQAHGSFPEKDTKITEETIEVPAGKFDCWLYTITRQTADGKPSKISFHFAKSLAGPPVKMVKETDGKVDSTMTLIECKQPGKKDEQKPADSEKPAAPQDEKPAEPPEGEKPAGN
jgi:hypothetical protein